MLSIDDFDCRTSRHHRDRQISGLNDHSLISAIIDRVDQKFSLSSSGDVDYTAISGNPAGIGKATVSWQENQRGSSAQQNNIEFVFGNIDS